MNSGSSNVERLRVRMVCAGIALALLSACGPGGPKRDTGDGGTSAGGGTTRTTGLSIVAGDAASAGQVNAKGAAARFNTPRGIVIDSKGNLYVADELNFAIRQIAPDGTVTTFAGTLGAQDYVDNVGNDARFVRPTALAIDAADNLYVTDQLRVRKITPARVVSTVTTMEAPLNAGEAVLNALIPAGIAVDGAGNLFVTTGIGTRRFAAANPGGFRLLEGDAARNNVPGTATLAPRGIAANSAGTAWVAGLQDADSISSVNAGGTALAPYAGTAGQSGSTNDTGLNARFGRIVALAADKDGNLYAADAGNNAVRKITTNVNLTTVAGTVGSNKLTTGALPGSLAELRGIAVAGDGTLYVTSGNAVVKIVP